jgi:hypothetical protein
MAVIAARIDRSGYYDTSGVSRTLGMSYGAIVRARKEGLLRSTKCGARTLYRGDWIEAWLAGDEQSAPAEVVGA